MSKLSRRLRRGFTITLLVLLFISPTLVLSFYSYSTLHTELTNQTLTQRKAIAQQIALTVSSQLDAIRDVGKAAASDISEQAKAGEWEAAVKEITYVSKEFPYVDRIFLSDLEGRTVAYFPASPENVNRDFSFRDWYKGVSKNWESYASEVFKRAPIPQLNTVAMMSPIKDERGTVYGAVGFAINLKVFEDLAQNFKVDKGGFLYIVNQKGQIIAHPKYPAQGDIIDYSSVPVVQKLMNSQSGIEDTYNPIEKQQRLSAYQHIPGYNWGVVVADPIETAFVTRDTILNEAVVYELIFIGFNILLASLILFAMAKYRGSQEKLRQSIERFEFVSKATNDAIYDWDIQTNSIYFGEGLYKLFKFAKADVSETLEWWGNRLHPDDQKRINEELNNALKGNLESFQLDYRFKNATGEYISVVDKAYLVRDSTGKPIRYIGVMQDVSSFKQYEEQLKKRTEEAEQLNKVMVERELKMIELKKRITELEAGQR